MVQVFREVKRVLRKDGVCFLNIGDSYAGSKEGNTNGTGAGGASTGKVQQKDGVLTDAFKKELQAGTKPKNMLLIPQRLALALQADGWWVRSDIIWAKPNPMPESVTDRPTKSHEYIWLLAKSKDYFWDQKAVKEKSIYPNDKRRPLGSKGAWELDGRERGENGGGKPYDHDTSSRNLRTVWTIATQPYPGSHYATYPEALVEKCIKAGTSEYGVCPKCGGQWERVVERIPAISKECPKTQAAHEARGGTGIPVGTVGKSGSGRIEGNSITTGWQPSCSCGIEATEPATVFDPFCGSGTTCLVAKRMGRSAIGLDLSYQYLRENAWERVQMNAPTLFDISLDRNRLKEE